MRREAEAMERARLLRSTQSDTAATLVRTAMPTTIGIRMDLTRDRKRTRASKLRVAFWAPRKRSRRRESSRWR